MEDLSIDDIDEPASFQPSDEQRDTLQQEKQDLQQQLRDLEKKIGMIDVALIDGQVAEQKLEHINDRMEHLNRDHTSENESDQNNDDQN